MLTRPCSKFISRAINPLSSRFSISFTRNNRCFICSRPALSGRIFCSPQRPGTMARLLQFLRELFEHVALDDVTHLIFAKISQLNSAFEPGAHFFHVVLEPAQSREPAIVNWLAAP